MKKERERERKKDIHISPITMAKFYIQLPEPWENSDFLNDNNL